MESDSKIEQYAHDLFIRKSDPIRKTLKQRAARITSNWNRRGLAASNLHFQELANNSAEQVRRIVEVLINTRVSALNRYGVRIETRTLNDIRRKAYSLCRDEQAKAEKDIIQEVERRRLRSFARDCSKLIAKLFHEINVETDREIRIRKAELIDQAPKRIGGTPTSSSAPADLPVPIAYQQFCRAVEQKPELATDDQVYEWLSEMEEVMPPCESWKRSVRKGRRMLGTQKNRRGMGAPTRSVVRRKDLD